jgi:hypothetical protein
MSITLYYVLFASYEVRLAHAHKSATHCTLSADSFVSEAAFRVIYQDKM